MDRLEPRNGSHVHLDQLEALQIVLALSLDQLLDPPGAVAVQVVAGYVVREVARRDPVVGGYEKAPLGIVDARHLLVRHPPLPLVLACPARLGKVRAAAAAYRNPADRLVAD